MIQIRYGCFETNSSSTHTLVMCNDREYKDFIQNRILIRGWRGTGNGRFITYEQALADLKKAYEKAPDEFLNAYCLESFEDCDKNRLLDILVEEDIAESYEHYGEDYEFFEDSYVVESSNEVIHVFGYYGYDS